MLKILLGKTVDSLLQPLGFSLISKKAIGMKTGLLRILMHFYTIPLLIVLFSFVST